RRASKQPVIYGKHLRCDLWPGEIRYHKIATPTAHFLKGRLVQCEQPFQPLSGPFDCRIHLDRCPLFETLREIAFWAQQPRTRVRPRLKNNKRLSLAQ